jgi:hypothetical protein
MKQWAPALVAIGLACFLSGCTQGVVSLTGDEDNLPPCIQGLEVAVEELTSLPDCDLKGTILVFPDGTELPMSVHGGSGELVSSESRFKYAFVNVGNYGVVTSKSTQDCGELVTWGTSEALARVLEASGDNWPCGE